MTMALQKRSAKSPSRSRRSRATKSAARRLLHRTNNHGCHRTLREGFAHMLTAGVCAPANPTNRSPSWTNGYPASSRRRLSMACRRLASAHAGSYSLLHEVVHAIQPQDTSHHSENMGAVMLPPTEAVLGSLTHNADESRGWQRGKSSKEPCDVVIVTSLA